MRGLLFVLVSLLISPLSVYALEIDVPSVHIRAKKTNAYIHKITVSNPDKKPASVRVYMQDFEYVEPYNGPKKFMPSGTTDRSLAQWATVNPRVFVLAPGKTQVVQVTIKPAEKIETTHCSVVFFETALFNAGTYAESVNVMGRIGALIFLDPEYSDRSLDFKIIADGQYSMAAGIKNTGNMFTAITASYNVLDSKSEVVARERIGDRYLLPGDYTVLPVKLDTGLPPGDYFMVLTAQVMDGEPQVCDIDFSLSEDGQVTVN